MAKTITKTYGEMSGLMEWNPIIHVGRTKFSPSFTGGGNSAFGITPAKYTTSDAFRQFLIEHSDYYKSGRITLLYKEESGVDETTEAEDPAEEESSNEVKLTPISFVATSDAANYLHDKYNVAKTSLRSKENIIKVGKDNGLDITFTD